MDQLGHTRSRDKYELANARHRLFKCVQRIFDFSIYVRIDELVVSL